MPKRACILVFVLLSGCTHTSHKEKIDEKVAPPLRNWIKSFHSQGLKELDKNATRAENWWFSYQQARSAEKTNPALACQNFLNLSQQKDFPLWDLAWVRSQLSCEQSPPNDLQNKILQNAWYAPVSILVREKAAAKTADTTDDIELLVEKSKHETQLKKKEALLLSALEQSKKLSDPQLSLAIENRLVQIFPRYQKNPTSKSWLSIAQDFRQFRKFPQAESFYKAVLRQGDLESQWSAWKGLRQIQKTQQNKSAILALDEKIQSWLKGVLKKNKTAAWIKRWHDHSLMQIRQLWTEDQYQKALKKLTLAAKTFENVYPRDEIFFLLARMNEERNHFKEAQSHLQKSLSEKESSPGLREKVLWSSAWLFYKNGDYQSALNRLNENLNLNTEPSNRYKYLFWKARAQSQLKATDSEGTYKTLAAEDPLGFYGLLAYYDRNLTLPSLKAQPEESLNLHARTLSEIPMSSGLKIDWLIALEEKEVLEEALKTTLDNIKNTKPFSEDSWLKLFSAFAQAQLYLPLFSNLNKINPETRDRLLKTHPELIFARPYDEFVLPVANKTGVSPWLIYSIMRQESAFDPEARSGVDAMGLLQLMPALGHKLAEKNGIAFRQAEELFTPEINIALGALELKNLLSLYKNNSLLAVSAYNANGKAIQGWLKTRLRQDPIEFIEEIPYEETRAYVKLVFRNFVFYERLNSPAQEIEFPRSLLSWPP